MLALSLWLATPAFAQAPFDGTIKIGVLTDQSSLYADVVGAGMMTSMKLAWDDYKAANPQTKLKPEFFIADHQNKPDIGASLARQWFDQGIDAIEAGTSSVALAVSAVAKEKNRIYINASAGTARLTGDACTPNTVHWTWDNYSQSYGTARAILDQGGDTWYFLTADYAFGHDLEAQASHFVTAGGGKVLGAVRAPLNTPDFSSYLLQAQASKAKVIGLANAGGDTANAIKQGAEFGIISGGQKMAALLLFETDIDAIGLKTAQGIQYTDAFYWDLNDATRDWTKRWLEKAKEINRDKYPVQNHAGIYAAYLHYFKAVEKAQSHDGQKVVEAMKAMPSDDPLFGKGRIREDGRHIHPSYLMQVKTPAESKSRWDVSKVVKTLDAESSVRPLSEGGCPFIKK
ncbi:MAG: ABC transporter substrate-binding protein [Proteobacteria bacterium]|nr:ABC transporter substrate-binding protein [Pseudomonadota bacterium]